MWRALARAVAVTHISYTLFVVVGSVLVLRWPWLMWPHILAVAWAGMTLIFDCGCPLTPWEKQFLTKGGVTPYEEGFLQHYFLSIGKLDPANSRRNHIVIGTIAVVFNAIIYYLILTRR